MWVCPIVSRVKRVEGESEVEVEKLFGFARL
jgi:hypothetical protein